MSDSIRCFIEPLDVLTLRGNRLFGDPGSYGEMLMPPRPSVLAGALRSWILVHDGIDPQAFAEGRCPHPTLGTPEAPGSFRLTALALGRKAKGTAHGLFPVPADLSVTETADGRIALRRLEPQSLPSTLQHSGILPKLPVLAEKQRSKPASGYWMTEAAWRQYLAGSLPDAHELVPSSSLWRVDERVGVGLAADRRAAADGKLFTTQTVVLAPEVGFLVELRGASLPSVGMLRLGGDGRGAAVQQVEGRFPEPDYEAMASARRCRVVLTSPGLFGGGWRPEGVKEDGRVELPGIRARLVAAAAPRGEVVSGWDLARWQPKPAQRAVPTGSVYWLEELEASADSLANFARTGWWGDPCENVVRAAEGFNRLSLAVW